MNDASTAPPPRTVGFLWTVTAAFGTYFCMYFYRKTFTAGTYPGTLLGLDYKAIFVIAQVMGYAISKVIGIKVVSEVTPEKRAAWLIGLIAVAQFALVGFALTPPPYNLVWLFVNGLPLGMVFGLVIGVLEGRRQTEALAAGLCVSFIVADGATRWLGLELINMGISEYWVPALAGLIVAPPLGLFIMMLRQVPPPTGHDVDARSERAPMNASDRWAFFRRYAFGLAVLAIIYLLITILRSVRGDYAKEIWAAISPEVRPENLGLTELCVGLAIMVLVGAAVLIRDNRRAFSFSMLLCLAGPLLILLTLTRWDRGHLSAFAYVVMMGIGLYLPYIAVHTIVFERLIAMTRDRGTMSYLMYLVDSVGYLGYVAVLLVKSFSISTGDILSFFVPLAWTVAIISAVLIVPAWIYFLRHPAARRGSA
jgi:hypothetical protein